MRRSLRILLSTIVALTIIGPSLSSFADKPVDKPGLGGSVGPSEVHVGGVASTEGQATGQPGSGVSQFTSVRCGPGVLGGLTSIGDSNAAVDASYCARTQIGCGAAVLKANQQQVVQVELTRQPDGTWGYSGTNCVVIGGGGPPQVTAAMVREQVVRLVPSAAVGLAPRTVSLVNIQTIMWVEAPGRRTLAPLTILGQRVLVNLTLDHVAWTFGDGSSAAPNSAGKAYSDSDPCRERTCPGYFGHMYRTTGRRTLTATTWWRAGFTVNGGPAVAIPGTVSGPGATANLTIKQARAVLIPDPAN